MLSLSAGHRMEATGKPEGFQAAPQIKSGVARVEASTLDRRTTPNRHKMRGAPTKLSRRFRDFSLTLQASPVTSSA